MFARIRSVALRANKPNIAPIPKSKRTNATLIIEVILVFTYDIFDFFTELPIDATVSYAIHTKTVAKIQPTKPFVNTFFELFAINRTFFHIKKPKTCVDFVSSSMS